MTCVFARLIRDEKAWQLLHWWLVRSSTKTADWLIQPINPNQPVPMPEITITAELPDGSFQPCYSPSPIARKYFKMGQQLTAEEFIRLSRIALSSASDLVEEKIAYSSSLDYCSLPDIERWAGALPPDTPVTISHVS
jgi:uncharacterized repeat protein (TIGR04042 family)